MYPIVAYVQGPEIKRPFLGGLFGGSPSCIYLVNPQLYQDGIPNSLYNWGIERFTVSQAKPPTTQDLEKRIKKYVPMILGDEVKVGRRLVNLDQVDITVEFETA